MPAERPADEALEFGVEYASVVVFGTGSVVEDPKEAEDALVLIMEKYAPHLKAGVDYRPVAPEEVKRTAVLRVDIEDGAMASKLFDELMGDEVEPRKRFIEKNARYVKNLDI